MGSTTTDVAAAAAPAMVMGHVLLAHGRGAEHGRPAALAVANERGYELCGLELGFRHPEGRVGKKSEK